MLHFEMCYFLALIFVVGMNYIFVNLQITYGSELLFSTVFQGLLVQSFIMH